MVVLLAGVVVIVFLIFEGKVVIVAVIMDAGSNSSSSCCCCCCCCHFGCFDRILTNTLFFYRKKYHVLVMHLSCVCCNGEKSASCSFDLLIRLLFFFFLFFKALRDTKHTAFFIMSKAWGLDYIKNNKPHRKHYCVGSKRFHAIML